MLTLLHIENVAVIESADIVFAPGLNALTGETGAGKSIVIDAIGALLGARVGRGLVRAGAPRAFVSGLFSGVCPPVRAALADLGIEAEDGELLLQREITADGRGTARINGRPVTTAALRAAGVLLINIHGQHDSQQLLHESTHLSYVDRCGGTGELLAEYRAAYEALGALDAQMDALRMDEGEKARRTDMLRYQIGQLEAADLQEGEDERLQKRKKTLQNALRLSDAVRAAGLCLSGDEDNPGAVAALKQAARALAQCADASPELEELSGQLQELAYQAEDAAEKVADFSFTYDEGELDAIETRLDLIERLCRRYGRRVADCLAHLAACREELDAIEFSGERLAALEKERARAYEAAMAAARRLHTRRAAAARELERQIASQLADLDMPRARFVVDFAETGQEPKLSRDGIDRVAFLIAVNAGEPPQPLSRVASGGELSRVMLAIQNVLLAGDDVETLIFDEVDAGLSGRAAGKVARKLANIAGTRQVLCVTHLAQLGAMADRHLRIHKSERGGRVYTQVTVLDEEARLRELANIISGEHITEAALSNVRDLIAAAQEYKTSIQQHA